MTSLRNDMTSEETESKIVTNQSSANSSKNTMEELFKQLPEEKLYSKSDKEGSSNALVRVLNWSYMPKRYIMTFLIALGMLLTFAMRTNVGVTVVMILDEQAHEKVESAHDIHEVSRTTDYKCFNVYLSRIFSFSHHISVTVRQKATG